MAEKKSVYETELIQALPLWLTSDNCPTQEPDKQRTQNKKQNIHYQKEYTIKKLIAHIREDDK